MTGNRPSTENGRPQRAAPTAVLEPRMVPARQAQFHSCGGHRIAQDRKCPVGAGLLTRPPFADHDARRARRPGAPPERAKPSALHKNSPKPGGRGKPLPYEMTGKHPSTENGRPQRAAPTAFLTAPFGPGETGAVPWLRRPSHRPGPKLSRRGGSQTRPSTADHDARREQRPGAPPERAKPPALHKKQSETRREGQAPPLQDNRETVPQRRTGGHRGPPLRRFRQDTAKQGGPPGPPSFILLCRKTASEIPATARPR